MHILTVTLYCVLSLTGLCFSQDDGNMDLTSRENQERIARGLIDRVMTAMEGAVAFFKEEYRSIIFDGMAGTARVAGQCQVILNHIDSGTYPGISTDLAPRIQKLIDQALQVGDLAEPHVANEKPHYEELKPWVHAELWNKISYPNRVTDKSLIMKPLYRGEALHGIGWEDCFTEVLAPKCWVSEYCRAKMYAPGFVLYSLSHQLLYLLLGEGSGCFKGEDLKDNDRYAKEFCANLLVDAEYIYNTNFPSHVLEDFWMEVQNFCGMVGFQEFFRYDWLKQILDWQWPQGCWGDGNAQGHSKRKKRSEKWLKYGCKTHTTTEAMDALAQYLRYLLDFLFKKDLPAFDFFSINETENHSMKYDLRYNSLKYALK